MLIYFYFRLISRTGFTFLEDSQVLKKAALEKVVPECDIFFFFSKVHQVGGTMGAAI